MRRHVIFVVLAAVLALAAAACQPTTITGIDISRWQHPNGAPINWSQVRAAGHRFAFIKATDPVDGTNPYFGTDWNGAGAAGLYRGAYHRARPAVSQPSALAQARSFVAVAGSHGGPADLPPVLDMEEAGGRTPAELVAWVQAWMTETQRLTGRAPILYTGYYFWQQQLGATTALSGYRLWLPQYTTGTAPYLMPSAWSTWTLWQHSNTGTVPGITGPVDLNRFCCDEATLAAMTGSRPGDGAGRPFGMFEQVSVVPGAVTVGGWAIDPDSTAPIDVHIYVDGVFAATTAGQPRPDVAGAYPGFGANHGFSHTRSNLVGGNHEVCVAAINIGVGDHTWLACRRFTLPGGAPFGFVDGVATAPGSLSVGGWTIDPDTTASIPVHVYVDNVGSVHTASGARPDVAAVYPAYGPHHGYTVTRTGLTPGSHTVCVAGINVVGAQNHTWLACRAAVVP